MVNIFSRYDEKSSKPSMRTEYLVLGAGGQVANALNAVIEDDVVLLGRGQLDLTDLGKVRGVVANMQPASIINAAAYTDVDGAEVAEGEAYAINATLPQALAEIALEMDIPLVHFSTDYVFDGLKNSAYDENDEPNPLNIYGKSKLAGDETIMQSGCKYLIFRTSSVYDAYSDNFFCKMLELGKKHKSLSVVSDQIHSPTYAPHLANAVMQAVDLAMDTEQSGDEFPSGLYNLAGTGYASWFEFAEAIFAVAKEQGYELRIEEVEPISAKDYNAVAKRPADSRLDCTKVKSEFGVHLPSWQEGLGNAIRLVV